MQDSYSSLIMYDIIWYSWWKTKMELIPIKKMFRLKILVKWEYGWYLKLLNKLDKTREKCGLMFSDELIFKYKKSILKYDIFHISLVIIFLPILAHGEVVGQYVCLWMITRLIWKRLCFILYVLLWDKKYQKEYCCLTSILS